MDINTIGNATKLNQNIPVVSQKTEKPDMPPEPQDHITLDSIGKKAAKGIIGTGLAVVLAPMNAALEGFSKSADVALTASGLGHFGTDKSLIRNLGRSILYAAPTLGAMTALAAGAGPIGIITGGVMMPGALAGFGSAISGGVDGAGKGINFAMKVGDKAEAKVSEKLGKIAGKVAKFATSVGLGMVAAPISAFVGACHSGLEFAEKAIGVNNHPTTGTEVVSNLVKEGAVMAGYVHGAVTATGGLGSVALGAASGAGAVATGVKGIGAAIDGFTKGVEKSFELADKAVDKLTEKK